MSRPECADHDRTQVDRRVARRLANRRIIEEAALRRFDAQGFENTTVDEIAADAGVSVRSFHYHFPTKRDVLVGDVSGHAELARALAARPDGEHPLVAFREALRAMRPQDDSEARVLLRARILRAEPHLTALSHDLFRSFGRVLAEDVARRCGLDVERDTYPRLVAAVAASALGVAVMSAAAAEPSDAAALPAAIDETLGAVLAGLPVPCGRVHSVASEASA
jgi:AcrR family transcriptional regulator